MADVLHFLTIYLCRGGECVRGRVSVCVRAEGAGGVTREGGV